MVIKERKQVMFKQQGRPLGNMNTYLQEDLDRRKFLGRKMKKRRRYLKKSQTEIGEAITVTFQQIQKYEKGINSVSAFRIEPLRIALEIPEHRVGFLVNKYNPKQRKIL